MIISRLMPEKPEIKVDVMKLTKQIGSNDCGLATALAYEVDPSTLLFKQNEMRTHLANCFMRQHLTQFPTKKTRRTTNSILSTVTVYVCPACRLTENGIDMVECVPRNMALRLHYNLWVWFNRCRDARTPRLLPRVFMSDNKAELLTLMFVLEGENI